MFDRLLGPKTDHADPKVRAKAYAQESVDQSTVNDALKSEQDADVLCVLLGRADDLSAVLEHAINGDGSIANHARTRLVALADAGAGGTVDEWARVLESAHNGEWLQLAAFNDLLRPEEGREAFVQGALQTLPENHDLPERLLFTLATQSASNVVRRLAARNLHTRSLLESCCDELREKDKTVYRELKERIDAYKLEDEQRQLAGKLEGECDVLAAATVMAQPEAVAVAHSRKQTLEHKIGQLHAAAPDIAKAALDRYREVGEAIERTLKQAREHVESRKKLKNELAALTTTLAEGRAEQEWDPVAELDRLRSLWSRIPDHTDLEHAAFDREMTTAGDLAQQFNRDRDVATQIDRKLAQWEQRAETEPPLKLLERIRREWQSMEKPRNEAQLAMLQQRVDALGQRLSAREAELADKRANNSRQLLLVLDDFVSTMDKGEFKKAMSLNDKLRARAANRELEPEARKRIEEELKKAQPRLEEFRKWRHFGTLQARENLLGQANTLVSDPPASPKKLAAEVKALREAWRRLDQDDGRASEEQWQAFNKACKEAYKPAKKHFEQLARERKANLAQKKSLIEELESLLKQTDWSAPDWLAVTKKHKDLITQWRKIGAVDYKVRKELDAAFDAVNNGIDEQLHDERESEVSRRRRLIERLRSEQQAGSGGRLAAAAKRAQKEWRPTVQSDRKTEQALWEEFRSVCDEIFGTLKQQQKEAKEAWQADVSEREAVCDAIDQLLDPGADADVSFDRKAANQASGQLRQLSKRWRQRHQIPAGVMTKLDKRFKASRRNAESRIESVLNQAERRATERLGQLHALCQRAEEALLEGTFDVDEAESHLPDFQTLRGVVGKALQKRYARVIQGMKGDPRATSAISAEQSHNLESRQALCLLGELVADIDSPPHAQNERMALRMKRLTEAMQGELPPVRDELADITRQWYAAGGVPASEWDEINARFAKVIAARNEAG